MSENKSCVFTCYTCGGHKLTVFHVWTILAGPDTETWQEWGPLDSNHLFHFEFKERIEKEKDRDAESYRKKFQEYAKDNSNTKPEEYEVFDVENNSGNDMFYVNCTSCDREIEFGWSNQNRDGRIYPAECSDFVPNGIWPEPRYLESWHQKGWIKTGVGKS